MNQRRPRDRVTALELARPKAGGLPIITLRATIAATSALALALPGGPAGAQVTLPAPKACSQDNDNKYCTTAIDFNIQQCEMCVITAFGSPFDDTGDRLNSEWMSPPVRHGETVLRVVTGLTKQMRFTVERPTKNDISAGNSVPLIVLGYQDKPAGSSIRYDGSARERSASSCWVGTDKLEATIHVSHRVYKLPPRSGPSDHVDDFWASPTLPVFAGSWKPTTDGGSGVQDIPDC